MSRDAFDAHGNRRVSQSDAPSAPEPHTPAVAGHHHTLKSSDTAREMTLADLKAALARGDALGGFTTYVGMGEYATFETFNAVIERLITNADGMAALLRETLQPGAYGSRSTLAARIEAILATLEKTAP